MAPAGVPEDETTWPSWVVGIIFESLRTNGGTSEIIGDFPFY